MVVAVELGHFDEHFVKNTRKRGPTGKYFEVFSSRYSLSLNGKFKQMMDTIRAFISKIKTLISIFKKGRGGFSSLIPNCAPMGVAENTSISLNMLKYHSECLNKLF